LLQSIGLAFLFVPINTLIYVNDVSGLSNLARNIGGSAERHFLRRCWQQVHQQYLVQHVQASSPAYLQQAGAVSRHLLTSTAALADAHAKAILIIYQSLQAQASVLSYIDILQSLSIICGCMIPLVLLMKRPPKGTQERFTHFARRMHGNR
jgi:DHA2 family multidrug resistance protein